MQNSLAKFFQSLAVNPNLAARFADPLQREAVIVEAGLSDQDANLIRTQDVDALHNTISLHVTGKTSDWTSLQTNQNNDNNDVSRFKRRDKLPA